MSKVLKTVSRINKCSEDSLNVFIYKSFSMARNKSAVFANVITETPKDLKKKSQTSMNNVQ